MERVAVVHDTRGGGQRRCGCSWSRPSSATTRNGVVENESEGGLGAFVPQPRGAWLKVGNLIGIRRRRGVLGRGHRTPVRSTRKATAT